MRKKRSPRSRKQNKRVLDQINHYAAGADMGAKAVWISVGEHLTDDPVRVFGTTTAQLRASAEWMLSLGVDTVALEATGVYWVPAYEIYEQSGLRPILINSQAIRTFNGMKKSDFIDCQWIQLLHTFGILQPSVRAEAKMIELRGYVRQRKTLTEQCSEQIQRMQKALTLMNVRLDQAVTDIVGVTGLRIVRAIVAGERDPARLAAMREPGCAKSESEITEALTGHWRDEQLFVLRQTVELWDFCQKLMRECDEKIEAVVRTLPVRAAADGTKSSKRRRKNQASFDGRTLLHERLGVDLVAIQGLEVLTVLTVISECGLDLSRFPTDKHFVSWLGLAPGTKKSGVRVLSSRSRRTTNRAATALRLAAQSLLRSKSELGAFGRSLRGRIGPEKAVTAVAAKLAQRCPPTDRSWGERRAALP
ncbi:MAG: IS110 family transposase [Acidobacteriota bacterium]|nr:IS110 family transposase [Acidobacteriota bacterium]